MKFLPKHFFIIFLLSVVVLGVGWYVIKHQTVGQVQAVGNLLVSFENDPLFVETGFLPGDEVTKFFITENGGINSTMVWIRTENEGEIPLLPGLAETLSVVIKEQGGAILYGEGSTTGPKTLKNLFDEEMIPLSSVLPGNSIKYEITIKMAEITGNVYQNAEVVFDLVVIEESVANPFDLPDKCLHLAGTITKKIEGTSGNDKINGTSASEYILGYEGEDKIKGGGGNDCLVGGKGDDILNGGTGEDVLIGNAGNDNLDGHSDNDRLYGGEGNDKMKGKHGDDLFYGGGGNDIIDGGSGNDIIYGGEGNDEIKGGSGNDTIEGGDGDDEMQGRSGDDVLIGNAGSDFANGNSGEDTCAAEVEIGCEL